MTCASCSRVMILSWHISAEKWKLLPRRWRAKILCIECFIGLVSKRSNSRVLLMPQDFGTIVIASRRVRGYLNRIPREPLFVRKDSQ